MKKIGRKNFCDFFKSKWCRIYLNEQRIDKVDLHDDVREARFKEFDDIVIEQTNERITQEIEISSSTETKANIMIGIIGLIFTLEATIGMRFFSAILQENIYFIIPFIIGSSLLVVSFCLSFAVIRPRSKLKLLTPRKLNNMLYDLPPEEVKYHLKNNLIENFEVIQKGVSDDLRYLKCSIGFFIFAIISLSIPFFVKAYTEFISKLHGS